MRGPSLAVRAQKGWNRLLRGVTPADPCSLRQGPTQQTKHFFCVLDIGLPSPLSLNFEIQMKPLRLEDGKNHLKATEGFKDSYKKPKIAPGRPGMRGN